MKRWLRIVLTMSLLVVSVCGSAADSNRKPHVLIVNSYSDSKPWVIDLNPLLTAMGEFDVSSELVHMDQALITNDSVYQTTVNSIINGRKRVPDVVVFMGQMALTMRDRMKREWGPVPMLYISFTDRLGPVEELYSGVEHEFNYDDWMNASELRGEYDLTFVEQPRNYEATVDMMVEMLPYMKKLYLIADEQWLSKLVDMRVRRHISEKYPDLEYEWIVGNNENSERVKEIFLTNNPEEGVLLNTLTYPRESALGYPELVAHDFRMMMASRQPVFATTRDFMDYGAIGGAYYDRNEPASAMRSAMTKILAGENPDSIPFAYSKTLQKVISYPRYERLADQMSDIPDDYIITDHPPTWLEQNGWGLAIVLVLIIAAVWGFNYQRQRANFFRRFNSIVTHMPIAFAVVRPQFDRTGKLIDIEIDQHNDRFDELVSTQGLVSGKQLLFNATFHPRLSRVFRSSTSESFLYEFQKTGVAYQCIVAKSMDRQCINIFGVNVTRMMSAERESRAMKNKLEVALRSAHIVPWTWDLAEGMLESDYIHLINRQGAWDPDMKPKKRRVSSGMLIKLIDPEQREDVLRAFQQMRDGETSHVQLEMRMLVRPGSKHYEWYEVTAVVSDVDAGGNPSRLTGSLLLISDRKEAENELISAREHALESDRLKSAFLANMSHEIRTPLNAIVGFSNLLCYTDDPDKREQYVNIISTNNDLLLQLINDVLDLAKVESNTMEFHVERVDVNNLIRTAEETVRMRKQPGVVLNFILGAGECHLMCDPNRLMQVLINFLTNACKFTTRGSITLGYEVNGEELYFYVKDTGKGINPEDQQRVFERFCKLDGFVQGTGLGLAISKSIIDHMGGQIGVESRGEGKGSTFWFTVPYDPMLDEYIEEEEVDARPVDPYHYKGSPVPTKAEDVVAKPIIPDSSVTPPAAAPAPAPVAPAPVASVSIPAAAPAAAAGPSLPPPIPNLPPIPKAAPPPPPAWGTGR
ncbi:MAG: HAMP domain-containing histidine kinase, partial [Muribaculaceae bacterium]|nr:HAMP domain-containing histidine kinase [Muribaculaceae bacterium]